MKKGGGAHIRMAADGGGPGNDCIIKIILAYYKYKTEES